MLYGTLEWFDTSLQEMTVLKEQLTNKYGIPLFIKHMLDYIRHMKFDETPDYDYLKHLLVSALDNSD